MFSTKMLEVINILAPGLISVIMLNSLVIRKKPNNAYLVIEAFIFTALNSYVATKCTFMDRNLALLLISLILPIILALIINKNLFSNLMIWAKITNKTSTVNTWLDIIYETNYVVIHFKDESRLQGYITMASISTEEGLLYVGNPSWVDEDGIITDIDVDGVVVKYEDISYIYNHKKE